MRVEETDRALLLPAPVPVKRVGACVLILEQERASIGKQSGQGDAERRSRLRRVPDSEHAPQRIACLFNLPVLPGSRADWELSAPIRLHRVHRSQPNDPGPDARVKLSRSQLRGSAVPSNGAPAPEFAEARLWTRVTLFPRMGVIAWWFRTETSSVDIPMDSALSPKFSLLEWSGPRVKSDSDE